MDSQRHAGDGNEIIPRPNDSSANASPLRRSGESQVFVTNPESVFTCIIRCQIIYSIHDDLVRTDVMWLEAWVLKRVVSARNSLRQITNGL
jgi:hypothetical protein